MPRQLVTATGSQFQELSTRVRQLERELREGCGRVDLADVLDRVQAEERSKLQLTLNLQVHTMCASAKMHRRGLSPDAEGIAGAAEGAEGPA